MTRFICRFAPAESADSMAVSAEETLSRYLYDYEYANAIKHRFDLLQAKRDLYFGMSTIIFQCPLPASISPLAPFHMDLVPIRTPVRSKMYVSPPFRPGVDASRLASSPDDLMYVVGDLVND